MFHYKRFTSLDVDSDFIEDYKQVQSGDCIVAFSRTDIYEIKQVDPTLPYVNHTSHLDH